MSLLTDSDIAQMRTVLNQSLPGTAYLLRATATDDGQGGETQAWGTAGTAACRLSPLSMTSNGRETTIGDKHTAIGDQMITLPAETQVLTTDRLEVDGQVFEVAAVHAPRSWELSVRVEVNTVV